MAISYTLSIIQTLLYPAGSFPSDDYLGGVMWQMTGTDGVNSSSKQGLARFDVAEISDSYIPFADLSQDTIIGWTQDVIGPDTLASIKADIANDIASKS
jgi:hypothetical protein